MPPITASPLWSPSVLPEGNGYFTTPSIGLPGEFCGMQATLPQIRAAWLRASQQALPTEPAPWTRPESAIHNLLLQKPQSHIINN
ncbi:MAG: hypothetical protein KJS74_05120 [Rhodospirillales bacterium]|nr:hypothetical protein [Rhodospirillales bacterium]